MKIETGQGKITLLVLIAIYSISMVTSLPGLAISPILGQLQETFKDASDLQLQLLESLPSFIVVPFILLSGRLSLLMDKRKLLAIGLSIFFLCSILYLFSSKMWMLLVVSALMGIGAGLVVPLSTGLIADYFIGSRRTQQLGISSAITNLTLVLATLLAGLLAQINWHLPFLVYALSGVSLFFLIYLKDMPNNSPSSNVASNAKSTLATANFKWPWGLMFFYCIITFFALTIPFYLSIYVESYHHDSASVSGLMISLFFLSMTVPGLFITYVIHFFKQRTIFFSIIGVTLGLFIMTLSHNTVLLILGVIIVGMGYGVMQPIIYDKTANSTSSKHTTLALSLVMAMNYIAIIIYPFIMQGFQAIIHVAKHPAFPFIINTIFAAIYIGYIYWKRNNPIFKIDTEKQ